MTQNFTIKLCRDDNSVIASLDCVSMTDGSIGYMSDASGTYDHSANLKEHEIVDCVKELLNFPVQ